MLVGEGFYQDKPTIWIAEEPLVYLEEVIVNKLMKTITALSIPNTRIGLTMSIRDRDTSLFLELRLSKAHIDPILWLEDNG